MQYPEWMEREDIELFEQEMNALLDRQYEQAMLDLDQYADEFHEAVVAAEYEEWEMQERELALQGAFYA